MKLPHATWFAVLDGEKFLLLRNHGDEEHIDLRVIEHETIDNPPAREQGTDRAGRFDDAGAGRSAVEETDWHLLEKERFADDIAERLNDWAKAKRFDRLVLAADPHSLGHVRPKLHKAVTERLLGAIDRDLTNQPLDRIEKTVSRW